MKVRVDKNNVIYISHKLKRGENYKIIKGSRIQSVSIFKKPQVCIGYSSRTQSGKHILILDYDQTEKEIVESDVRTLMDKYKLPPAYLFKTKEEGWHVVFLSKHYIKDIFEMMRYTHVDSNFRDMPRKTTFKDYILRISSKSHRRKPRYIGLVGDNVNLNKEISEAHLKLLKKLYPKLPNIPYKNKDGGNKLFIKTYETG